MKNDGKKMNAEIIKAVEEASQVWITAFNGRNAADCASVYSKDAIMKAEPFGEYKGRKAIQEFWQGLIVKSISDVKYTNIKYQVESDDVVKLSASWTMMVGSGDDKKMIGGEIYEEKWERTEEGWKLTFDHFEQKENFTPRFFKASQSKSEATEEQTPSPSSSIPHVGHPS